MQAFAGIALYLYLPENILQMPEFVGTGYGCSLRR
jgi:hypothetical protein